ncbi:MAG TPA: acylphosphatase [Methanoregula sp.]|nr:acylphosphatase [Methanoregula sp.]
MERITAVAKGKVQGVGYRHFVASCAHMTGVHGFVRNMPDGSVMMVAESSRASLEDFVRLVRASEEPVIKVRDLSVTPCAATGEYKGFWVDW